MAKNPKPLRKQKRAFFNNLDKSTYYYTLTNEDGHKILMVGYSPRMTGKNQIILDMIQKRKAKLMVFHPKIESEPKIEFYYDELTQFDDRVYRKGIVDDNGPE